MVVWPVQAYIEEGKHSGGDVSCVCVCVLAHLEDLLVVQVKDVAVTTVVGTVADSKRTLAFVSIPFTSDINITAPAAYIYIYERHLVHRGGLSFP